MICALRYIVRFKKLMINSIQNIFKIIHISIKLSYVFKPTEQILPVFSLFLVATVNKKYNGLF